MEIDFTKAFDGKRLTNMSRACVQANGNLNFPSDAIRQLGLTLDKALLVCPFGEKDLAVTLTDKDDERGFPLKKTGPYYYVSFRSLMNECGIDYVKMKVIYDIIELRERYEGRPVFKFNRRMIERTSESEDDDAAVAEAPKSEEAVAQ